MSSSGLKLLLAMLLLLFCGCAAIVSEPKVKLLDTNIIGLDSAGVEVELYLGVTNPNSFDLSLLGYSYDLRIQTLPFANAGALRTVRFPANTTTDMALPVRITYHDLIELLKRLPNPDKIPYAITARLQIDSPVGEMSIPVDEKGSFAVPDRYRPSALLRRIQDSLPALGR